MAMSTTVNFNGTVRLRYTDVLYYSTDGVSYYDAITPIIFQTTDTLTVLFTSNITLTTVNDYFIVGSNNITFNGDGHIVEISGVSDYSGLIQNGTSESDGYENINIQYILIKNSDSTLALGSGWLCQSYFDNGTVDTCCSNGSISNSSGGLFGSHASNCSATACYSVGPMSSSAGGIYAPFASNCFANDCYSMGNIGNFGGGIYGNSPTSCVAENCYSLGSVLSVAGGIFGYTANTCTATNCYSAGVVDTIGYGIFGEDSTECVTTNCYSEGDNETSGWHTANVPISDISSMWVIIGEDIPYLLKSFDKPIYSALGATILRNGSTSMTIYATMPSFSLIDADPSIEFNEAYQLVGTETGTFNFKVMNYGGMAPILYSINDFILTVTGNRYYVGRKCGGRLPIIKKI
uniref:GLUG domain-containing protein n=1 Tax=viral metagenome TaxID=1070528 RepID=A0A6C0ECI8_9ZZZZ